MVKSATISQDHVIREDTVAAPFNRFIGHYTYNLDSKGRVSIPPDFREVLADRFEERMVVMKDYDQCLSALPVEEWERLDDRISELPTSDPMVTKYLRNFISSAKVCELDKQGRILIPPALKAYAGLKREVLIIGMSKKIELWDMETYNKVNASEDNEEVRKAMAEFGV